MSGDPIDAPLLELESMIGFCGGVTSGLKVHPDRQHLLYPIGCTIAIEHLESKKQEFLSGHTDSVSCIAISKSGRYIASGQITHMGFKADVIIWDFEKRKMHAKLTLHMVKVEALAFSPNDKYLVSLGGEDDGSVVVWNLANGEAICGSPAQVMSAGNTHTVAYSNLRDDTFVTGGNGTLRVWQLDVENRKIRPTEVNMGQLKRVIKCIEMDADDGFFYCGTTSGDIMAVNMKSCFFQEHGPLMKKTKKGTEGPFSLGITAMKLLDNGDFLVGSGDGTVAVCKGKEHKFKQTNKITKLKGSGAITSIALRGKGHQFFVGTEKCNIYKFNFAEFCQELTNTCHYAPITDVCFPYGTSELFVTSSYQDIRVWANRDNTERLRIVVPNMTCNAIEVLPNGLAIISGWDDGRVRAFAPQTGKPMYTINDAHGGGVTALASFSDCDHIVSGGNEGGVRVWRISKTYLPHKNEYRYVSKLMFNLKEHKASVTCIKVQKNNKQCVSSSVDGSCIIWDLIKECRVQMIRINTLFQYVCYHPAESQIIATGTDRKISYFEVFDACLIRDLEGSLSGGINCMDITPNGRFFVSGGADKLVKIWKYDEGEVTHIGIGHSAPITRVKIAPGENFVISVSSDGAILKWRFPFCPDY